VLVGLLAGLFSLVGCRGADTEQIVAGHHELCCKAADPDNIGFVGCRASAACRTSERVWVRGPVTCEPADPQRCAGGRCCKLDLEAIATLEIDRTQVVRGPGQAAVAPEPEPAPEPTPEPASIVPVPLDWQARPTPVTIPKLVCDVAGSVELAIEVDATGRVTTAEIRRGIDPQCDALARDALLHAEFEPARTPDGQAIASSLTFVYDFSRDAGGG
jgi:TonB family protein